jgi:hypothetical protein
MSERAIDPVCLFHGKRWSEHHCLYCCLCFKTLTVEECHVRPDGTREDVCEACAEHEIAAALRAAFVDPADRYVPNEEDGGGLSQEGL